MTQRPKRKLDEYEADAPTKDALKYSTVTMKWATLCHNPIIQQEVDERVLVMKKVQIKVWHVANLHMLRCHQDNIPLPELTQTCFYRCCTGVLLQANGKPAKACIDKNLNDTLLIYRAQRQLFADECSALQMSNVFKCLNEPASTTNVNATNHIVASFDRRLHRYIQLCYGTNGKETRALISSCFREDEVFTSEETEFREWLEAYPPSKSTIKVNLSHFLRKTYEMLQYMKFRASKELELAGCRAFSLLPLVTSFIPAHTMINMTVLHEMNKVFQVMRDKLWAKGFHIRKFEAKNRKFVYQITMNSYSASLLQQHLVKEKDENMMVLPDNYVPDTVVGIDPGTQSLCTTIRVREVDVEEEKAKCNRKEPKQN